MKLTKPDDVLTVTTSMNLNGWFKRGDQIVISGMVAVRQNIPGFATSVLGDMNGQYVVERVKGNQLLVQPATFWDHVRHYAIRFAQWVRWHWYGMIDTVGDAWKQLRKKLS
ncbi:MAG: hypothetical protein LAO08_06460 [Acidobacteriia bacterium]|nr:hypothetical protein [Terriglobia bacterium]